MVCSSLLWSCRLMRGKTVLHPWVTPVTSPNYPHAHTRSSPLHSVGKRELNPDHCSEHNGPKVVISLPESLIRVLSCHLFSLKQHQTAQSTPSDQSCSLHISPFPPFLSLSLNNGQSHINTQGFFHCVHSPRWPHYPRVFCLFVPWLKKLN